MQSFIAGYLLSFSLIMAIGAQNAFVLRQGLRGEHVLAVVLTCAISDAILIAAGVAGFGALVEAAPQIEPIMRYGGAAFLLVYAFRSALSAWRGGGSLAPQDGNVSALTATIATCLALTWLNPHVYLDTVILLGSIAANYAPEQFVFGVGAVLASFCFFFALGFGASLLRPFFANPVAWRWLDGFVALVMVLIALGLIFH